MPKYSHKHKQTKKIRWIFISLFLLFIVPLTAAFWMVNNKKPLLATTTNHGELIHPPLDIELLKLPTSQKTWKGDWLLLYVNPGICETSCAKALYDLRQIHKATGKDRERVARGILTFKGAPADPHLQTLLKTDFKGTWYMMTTREHFKQFTHGDASEKTALTSGGIYIVDPMGDVMMFYPLTIEPMGIFKDLTRLLKLSHIG